ncbi:MAG TPA: HAMP domain-containing histidine kinase [Sulfurimonas sp.]|nr:HAMP domain-containing histidine kinase [Sulfurimonas sp.]
MNLLENITLKKANLFTILIVFIFSFFFVVLLTQEIYKDYSRLLDHSIAQLSADVTPQKIEKELHLKSLLIKTILIIFTLSFIIFTIAFGFYKVLNEILQKDIRNFLSFFEDAVSEKQISTPKSMFFKDFQVMGRYASEMLQTINEQKSSLEKLNVALEKKVERKTEDMEKLLISQKEFLRYAVHETNTPLSVILTSIELYSMKHPKERQLSKIEAAVKNIFTIYDDLSYLVKKDQVSYPKVVINLDEYINTRVDFFDEVAAHSLVSFQYKSSLDTSHILFNETKLQRIVDNTITNAIKYTQPNEKVDVSLKQEGSYLEFSMGSKSKMIQNVSRIFEAYYRESKDDEKSDGFGLGLKLVRSICEEEDVLVHVSSQEEYTLFSYKFKMMGQ